MSERIRETLRIIQDGWGFACEWYKPEEIERCIQNQLNDPPLMAMPEDVYSREFAEWLTDQYRLAMRKGIELVVEAVRAEQVQQQAARIAELERENAELKRSEFICKQCGLRKDSETGKAEF